MPHLGLASLSAVLKNAGHRATVLDEVLYDPGPPPALEEVLEQTQPDVVGFSVYTSTLDRTEELMARARAVTSAPILVGGPHATLWADDLVAGGLADYVVRGEAEGVIAGLVEEAQRQERAQAVEGAPPDVRALPWPDYSATLNWQKIALFPIMTSRGCPYACTFCGVHRVSSRRWRPRDPADCVAELAAARRTFANLWLINVSDDCPAANPDHFKTFLRLLAQQEPRLQLLVDSMRADTVDEELVVLMKAAGADSVCLGVEHGNPEVFALINKGETHDDIRRAAALIRKHGLGLALCFVIGLPGDTLQRTEDSIRFARTLRAGLIYWNMAHPFPGTEMHQWFVERGATVDPARTYSSYDTHRLSCPEPMVETPEFSKRDRQRAYIWAVLETNQHPLNLKVLPQMMSLAWQYRLLGPALRALGRRLVTGSVRRIAQRLGLRR